MDTVETPDYEFSLPAELEVESQRELLHALREHADTQHPEVQALLQAWVEGLQKTGAKDLRVNWEQARLYEAAGLTDAALNQLDAIFGRLDHTAAANRSQLDRAIGNLAIDMEERLLRPS
jgi:hypothetical protein